MVANRVDLKVRGRYAEAVASVGTIKPGHVVKRDSSGELALGPSYVGKTIPLFALGDGLRGAEGSTGRGIWDVYSSGDAVPYIHALPGDEVLAWINIGQNITQGDRLISYGDGTLVKAVTTISTANLLNVQVAASSNITNTASETDFSRTMTIAAGSLKAGDVLVVRGTAVVSNQNSTDTLTCKLYFGATAIITTAAVDVATSDIWNFTAIVTIRTIGASGTFVASAGWTLGVPGTATSRNSWTASTAIDTTAAITVKASATWSNASTSNVVALQAFNLVNDPIDDDSLGYFGPIAEALETVDNSAGSAAAHLQVVVI